MTLRISAYFLTFALGVLAGAGVTVADLILRGL